MKKIGVFLNCIPYQGGSFQYAQSMLDGLNEMDKKQYDIVAIYVNKEWQAYLNSFNFITYQVDLNYFTMAKKIDSLKCDLIICTSQDELPSFLATPTIGVIHDLMHRYEPRFPEVSSQGEFTRRECLYRNIIEYTTGVIVDSEVGKQQVIESYGDCHEKKLFVLPFTFPQYLLANNIKKNNKEKYIFYPAQFWQHKNHKNLILAIHQLKSKGIEVKLVLVGSKKNAYDEVRGLITSLNLQGNIKILGYVSDAEMVRLYKNARALVMPTFFGPTNIPPLEGFVTGCPVAVSNIYGMPKQVGEAALLFDPNSINDIAEVIEKLWNDDSLCEKLIRKGYEQAKLYSREIFNERLNDIIENVISNIEKNSKKINEFLAFFKKYKKVYLYGAGEYGHWVRIFLSSYGIQPSGFVVSEKKNNNFVLGLKVFELEEVLHAPLKCGFILSVGENLYDEIVGKLHEYGITEKQYLKINEDSKKIINLYFASISGMIAKNNFLKNYRTDV